MRNGRKMKINLHFFESQGGKTRKADLKRKAENNNSDFFYTFALNYLEK